MKNQRRRVTDAVHPLVPAIEVLAAAALLAAVFWWV